MQDQKTTTLTMVFSDVLANLAFMFTGEPPPEPLADDVWLEGTIRYYGPVSGSLRLRCTRDFSIALAANLLGTDADHSDAEENANDAIKELMNILCGQFVTSAYGTGEVFRLTIPQIAEIPETPELAPQEGVDSSVISVDGRVLQLVHST